MYKLGNVPDGVLPIFVAHRPPSIERKSVRLLAFFSVARNVGLYTARNTRSGALLLLKGLCHQR